MKKKEQYRRIKTAKNEWIYTFKLNPSNVITSPCTEKLVNELMEKYKVWSSVENSHCCYGWRKCCWVDVYENDLIFSDDDTKCISRGQLMNCRRSSRKMPVFHICYKADRVYILITYRHLSGKDYFLTGVTDRKTLEMSENIRRAMLDR